MINTFVLKPAVSSIVDSIFVLDNKFNTLDESAQERYVEEDCQTLIEPSAEANLQFTQRQQETTKSDCRTPDIDAVRFSTVWTREAMWPI